MTTYELLALNYHLVTPAANDNLIERHRLFLVDVDRVLNMVFGVGGGDVD